MSSKPKNIFRTGILPTIFEAVLHISGVNLLRRPRLRRDELPRTIPVRAGLVILGGVLGGLRSEVNIELNFPPKLRGARSRLYRRRFLQVNTRWKALAEIYTMHSFAPFFNLKISAKNRHHFFAIE